MRHLLLPLVLSIALGACGGGGSLPLDLEVKDGALSGKFGELQIAFKTLPGAQVRFEGETKDAGDDGTGAFVLPKAKLKVGSNTFSVEATQSSLFSKRTGTATASWVARPKNLVRVYPPASGDFEGEIACGGMMCGASTLKVSKDGRVPIEVESAVAAPASVDGQSVNVAPAKRAAVEIDFAKRLGAMGALKEEVSLPVVLAGDSADADALELSGPAVTAIAARALGAVEKGPVVFAGEPASRGGKPDALAVVGAPVARLIVVGKAGTYQDVDLVAVARPVERFFGCGKGEGGPGILYKDLEVKVYDRRSGGVVGTRKLLADRVACPPTPTGIVKGDVREDDLKKVLGEFLAK